MKRQAPTAIAVFHQDIKPTLSARQAFVQTELAAFIDSRHYFPTSLELLVYVQRKYRAEAYDVNSIRPRLFELEQHGRVRHGVRRRCDVSGKTVMTWVPSATAEQARLQFAGRSA